MRRGMSGLRPPRPWRLLFSLPKSNAIPVVYALQVVAVDRLLIQARVADAVIAHRVARHESAYQLIENAQFRRSCKDSPSPLFIRFHLIEYEFL